MKRNIVLDFDIVSDELKECLARETSEGSLLDLLANDKSYKVRLCVARNENSIEALNKLSTDSNVEVRQAVAEHLSTSLECLERLAGDPYLCVREGVAGNPSCSPKILDSLLSAATDDPSWSIQRKIYKNPRTSKKTLHAIENTAEEIRNTINPYFKI